MIDKEPVLEQRRWGYTVFSNIQLKKMTGFGLKFYETEPIPFAQDTESLFKGVKIIEIQGCDFTGSGAGIIEQMEQSIIPEAFFSFQINRLKDLQHLILIKKSDKALLFAFLGNIEDGIYDPLLIRMHKANHFGKGLEGCKPMIACFYDVFSFILEILKKCNEQFCCDMFHPQ